MRAASAAGGAERALRIGVVRRGRIVFEKLVRDRRSVTVGPDEKCDLVLPVARGALFSAAPHGRIWLHLSPGMKGRVSAADGTRDIEAALSQGERRIALDDRARGRVEIGEAVVLFQMVHPPPRTPKPQLPAAVQGGFWRSVDWRFTGFVTTSFVAFLSFMVFLESADFPVAQTMALLPEDFATLLLEEPEPPPEPDVPEVTDGDAADAPSDELADASDVPSDAPTNRRPRPRDDQAPTLVEAEAIRTAALLEIGTLMSGDDGATAIDLLIAGADTTDAAGILAMVDATTSSANADGSILHQRGSSSGTPSGDGIGAISIATHGHHEVATAPLDERVITGFVDPQRPTDEGGTGLFESRVVTARVRAYMAGIRRCYERELRSDPTLAGKVTTKFTILESGGVTNVSSIENTTGSPALAQCVGGIIERMRFRQGPEGGSVDFSYPFVFAPQR